MYSAKICQYPTNVVDMKVNVLYVLLCVVAVSYCAEKFIVLRTEKQQKLYNFFPLSCDYLEFRVKATNDIHIVLTPSYTFDSLFYEIVIGGWGNTKSVIRKDRESNVVAEHNGNDVDTNSYALYWVQLNNTEGSISVGRGKSENPFLYYRDTDDYRPMKYFGVSTGFNSDGEWLLGADIFFCKKNYKGNADVQIGVV